MKTCPVCEATFEPKTKRAVYCSHSCANKGVKMFGRVQYSPDVVDVVCAFCKKTYRHNMSRTEGGKFCSVECYRSSLSEKRASEGKRQTLCVGCGKAITARRTTKKWCSDCWEERQRSFLQSHYEQNQKVCPCGNKTGASYRQYCSKECRSEFGQYKRTEMKTATCLGCGEEFSKPHHYPSKMRYCSTKCANTDIRKTRDKYVLTLPDRAVILKSGLEVRFLAVCLRFGLECRKFDGDRFDTDSGNYAPDFIVSAGDKEFVVEVKGTVLRGGEATKLAYGSESIDGYRVCFIGDLERLESGDLSFFHEDD